jgi:hypothetical protein
MNLPFCILIACALLGSNKSSQVVKHSTSPDGKFELSIEQKGDYVCYHVETTDKKIVSDDFKSDFGGPSGMARCEATPVLWRSDGNYFILHEATTRNADGFYIVTKTSAGFKPLPFDRGEILKSAKIDPSLSFNYASFKAWLPGNRVELIIRSWDGVSETSQPVDFVLDLTNGLNVLSWKVLKPEKGHGR